MLIAIGVEIELRFALRSTVSEIMAIKVWAVAAILDFSKHLKMAFWATPIALGVEIELRFTLRNIGTSENGQNGIWPITYFPLGLKFSSVLL